MRYARLRNCAALGLMLGFPLLAQKLPSPSSQTVLHTNEISVEGYRQHLVSLQLLVDGCVKARDTKNCDPALVGNDDGVRVASGSVEERRLVRYGWLRTVLQKAASEEGSSEKGNATGKPAATSEAGTAIADLLKEARARLDRDLLQARKMPLPTLDYDKERAVMREVLAGKEFRNLQEQTVKDSVLEKFARWLNHLFAGVGFLKLKSAWIGRVIVWGFVLGICVALVYLLIRIERRWRVRLIPDDNRLPAADAASARDWQLWLEDSRRAAAKGKWREAIHFLYWAAISRLESRRLWPADRARTPREYLALVAQGDARKPGLLQLTSAFERFWYGGRAADESDYHSAERVALGLIDGGPGAAGTEGGAR